MSPMQIEGAGRGGQKRVIIIKQVINYIVRRRARRTQ
jgi:hypothetical protein